MWSRWAPNSVNTFQRGRQAMPRFVVMRMTPLAACVPYSVPAAGPFAISMLAMSSGFRSLRREKVCPPTPIEVEFVELSARRYCQELWIGS